MARREFTKAVQVAIIKRATDGGGWFRCESCRAAVVKFEIHHKDMDALEVDKSRKLKPEDGELLCIACHKEVTKAQAPVLAKALRREAKHLGAKKISVKIPTRPKVERAPKSTFIDNGSQQNQILRRYVDE